MHQQFEEFIRQLQYTNFPEFLRLDWNCISRYNYLSETFLEEFSEYVNWIIVFDNQRLSETFKIKYISKANSEFKYKKNNPNFVQDYLPKKFDSITHFRSIPCIFYEQKRCKYTKDTCNYLHIEE